MGNQWTGRTKVFVRLDEHCQAAGTNSKNFNSFLGTLERGANFFTTNKVRLDRGLQSVTDDTWNILTSWYALIYNCCDTCYFLK